MELRRDMVALTAPADAVVLDLAQRSIGSVVREAEPIVTLVPIERAAWRRRFPINARDIARGRHEEPVRLKLDAYPFQKFGTASGTIRTISQDAYTPNPHDASSGSRRTTFLQGARSA